MKFRRHGLKLDEYRNFVSAVRMGWSNHGIRWLKEKFREHYRGHFGLLGNAILAAYAQSKCLDVVVEPSVIIEGVLKAGKSLRLLADVAICYPDSLLVLEVKVHHRGEPALVSQLDDAALSYGHKLRKDHRVHLGVLHMFMHTQPPAYHKKPKWVQLLYLHPDHQQAMENVEDALKGLGMQT